MNKQQAQTLAELFPSLKTTGIPSRYSAVDQIGFRFDSDLSGGEFWRLAACVPDKHPYLLGQGDLKSPFGQAIVEKMLELIAEREGWDIERTSEIHSDEAGDFRLHFVEILDPYQGPLGNLDRKVLGKAEGEGGLNQFAAAMIAAKQGQS